MAGEYVIPEGLFYTKEHEWVRLVEGNRAVVGITDYAVKMLRDIVYVSLPEVGASIKAGEVLGTVESVKAVSEIYTPISGRVIKVNDVLTTTPELVAQSPYEEGWIAEIEPSSIDEVRQLQTPEAYAAYIKELSRKDAP